jgi:hypothetical protein
VDSFFQQLRKVFKNGHKKILATVNGILPDEDDLYLTFPTSEQGVYGNAPMLICHPKAWGEVKKQYPTIFREIKGEFIVDLESAFVQGEINEDITGNT